MTRTSALVLMEVGQEQLLCRDAETVGQLLRAQVRAAVDEEHTVTVTQELDTARVWGPVEVGADALHRVVCPFLLDFRVEFNR